jgi:outer membrane protein assembly factor BamA
MKTKLIVGFCSVLLFLSAPLLPAQKFMPKSIQFKGADGYSDQELLAAAGLKKGEFLDNDAMNASARQLMDTGLFSSVGFNFDGQNLIFTLAPATDLFPFQFDNLPLNQDKDTELLVRRAVPLYHGKIPLQGSISEQVAHALEAILGGHGIHSHLVSTTIFDLKTGKPTALSFSITDIPVVLGAITVQGIETDSQPTRAALYKLSGEAFGNAGSARQIELALENLWRDQGYLEAEAHATPHFETAESSDKIRIPFSVSLQRGQQYRVNKIILDASLLTSQADFDRQSNIHPGDLANAPRIRANWEFLARQYHNRGFLKPTIQPVPAFDHDAGTVTYHVSAIPGPVYVMGGLTIESVPEDIRKAILAAWPMRPGVTFNEGAIRGVFTTHDVNPALERFLATVNYRYTLQLHDDTGTVDVHLIFSRR